MLTDTIAVNCRKRLPASAALAFRAWTEPELVKKWWGPTDNYLCTEANIDLRVGGAYRFRMKVLNNEDLYRTSYGKYLEITPNRKLVFTWNWKDFMEDVDSVVTLEFVEVGESETDLILTHEKLPNTDDGRKHEQGWGATFEKLATLITDFN